MNGRAFVDTNILIYAHDVDAGEKRVTARRMLEELWVGRNGVLSMQVLQEFYVNATRKIAVPLSRERARAVVKAYGIWCVETTPEEIGAAFGIEDEAGISFWDAPIVASAVKAGAGRILTEDLNHGQTIAGVLIENPFLPS